MTRISPKNLFLISLAVVAILAAGGSYYYFSKNRMVKSDPNQEAKMETESLILAVGKLMDLPQDETPNIATISAKEKVAGLPFFQMAENGDKLLVYNIAMQAILYRPGEDKIINVASIVEGDGPMASSTAVETEDAQTTLTVAYYNGTDVAGLAKLTEKTVKDKYPGSLTALVTNASKVDYEETLVIDFSGTHGKAAADIALLLKGKTGTLPEGEVRPDADILIISGR